LTQGRFLPWVEMAARNRVFKIILDRQNEGVV